MAWMTRKQVRSQPVQSYSERQLQKLLDAYDQAMGRLNDQYLRAMGEHIRDIGTIWPSDVHRLQQIRRMNKNLRKLQRRIGVAAGRTESEIGRIFQKIAEEDVRMQQKILGVPDILRIENNKPLQRILQAQARETGERMRNLSNTTVVSSYYRDAVDEAVTAVQSGVEDYNTAIRRVIREAGEQGMRVTEEGTRKVDYESGWSRRLDTAARMNVLDGVRHLNQSIMEEVSRQFGANGVEIDAHMLCAEDHLPYQGGQYSNEEFEEIQDSLERPFGEWNCRHSWHGIILGVSPPTYTPDQLDQMQRYSTEMITIDGRTKTRYQWSQEMRRMETAVRQQKDTANLARATGDDKLRLRCQGTILQLNQKYEALANKAGLQPEFQRTYVAGFKDVKYTEVLTNAANSGTIEPVRSRVYRDDGSEAYQYPKSDVIQKMSSFEEINEYFSRVNRYGEKEYLFSGRMSELPLDCQKALAESVLYMQEAFKNREWPSTIRVQKTATVEGREVAGYYDGNSRKIVISMKGNPSEGDYYRTGIHEQVHHYDRYGTEADYCVKHAERELRRTVNPLTGAPYSRFDVQLMRHDTAGGESSDDAEVLAYSVERGMAIDSENNLLAQIVNKMFYERNARG